MNFSGTSSKGDNLLTNIIEETDPILKAIKKFIQVFSE